MIDWLSSGRKGLTSNGGGIVEYIDNDWASYIGKVAKRKASNKFNDLSKSDPNEAIKLIRERAKKIGERSVVRLRREATRANREYGTGWRTLFVQLMDDKRFAKAVDSLLDSNTRWGLKYNRRELNNLVIVDLKKLVNERTKHSYYDASDVIEGATGVPFPLGAGHGGDYFTDALNGEERRAAEFFAEACSAKVMNDGSLEVLRELFPTAMERFERIVKEVLGC